MVSVTIKYHHLYMTYYIITIMSSKKEERKDETTVTSRTISPTEGNTDYRQSVNKALNETKDNVRRATDEARSQVPRYTQAVNDYQEQTIQASREIADNYLESQKEIINSLQSAWVPFAENAYGVFWNYWISPRRVTEAYAKVVSGLADNTIAATRLANNMIFANMETFKATVQHARDNTKELSRIGVNAAKTFEQTSRETTRNF
jgi:predicted component of type VI protein secretion system